jgi:heat shock protein HslJ
MLILAACASPAAPTPAPAMQTTPKPTPNPIQNILWQWTSVTNQTTKQTTTVPNPENYTITFKTDGTLNGNADCNLFSGTYSQQNGFSIKLGPTTKAYCGDTSMDQQYLQLLSSIAAGGPDGMGGLALENAGGEQRMMFKNGGPATQDLAGTSWQAISYNNGKQAVTSVLAGTILTADFGKAGNLSGDGGCNSYNGPYKVNGNQITIGPLASSMKACGSPAGVMDQESQYLAALQSAAIYKIEGTVLELRTKDGALAAKFNQK